MSSNQQEQLTSRVKEAALEHPFAFALGLIAKSRKDAARLAQEHDITGDEERYVEDVAIFKRDAATLFGTDFLSALKQILNNQEEEVKVKWSPDHYRRESEKRVQKLIREIVEKTCQGRPGGFVLEFNSLNGSAYISVPDSTKSNKLAVRIVALRRSLPGEQDFFEGVHKYHLGPVNLEVRHPEYLELARELGKHWQRRVCRQYQDKVTILKDY